MRGKGRFGNELTDQFLSVLTLLLNKCNVNPAN
jgi:hypothetical protein